MNAPAFTPTAFVARLRATLRPQAHVAPEIAPSVLTSGEAIYVGRVYALDGETTGPTYVYERRVDGNGARVTSTHVTRDPAGALVLVESAEHSSDYALRDYTLHANQLGQSGSVRVEDGKVSFRLVDRRGERTKVEALRAPIVTGPTLIGFMVRHLDALAAGEALPVRMAVLDRLETIGFELRSMPAPQGLTRIRMKASNFLYALAIDPIEFTFDSAGRKLLRLRGRVPPKLRDGNGWRDFDARVEYAYIANAYR